MDCKVASAITRFHWDTLLPMYLKSPAVTGIIASSVVSVKDIRRSPHPARNVNTPTVRIPGTTNGKMINQNALQRPQPSICAASANSFGTERKDGHNMTIAKGRLMAVSAKINAGYVFSMPSFPNTI